MQEAPAEGRVLDTTAALPAPHDPTSVDQLHGKRPEAFNAHGRSDALFPAPQLPGHLGWQSEPLAASLRASAARQAQRRNRDEARRLDWLRELAPQVGQIAGLSPASLAIGNRQSAIHRIATGLRQDCDRIALQAEAAAVKLYPDVALGMLRMNLAAAGRIWLLLRHLDCSNGGWVDEARATQQLTGNGEPLRVCGRRQWRNLLAQGEGLFWQQRNGRLWLRSVAKVAAALGVERLAGSPVALPLDVLTQGIGAVRAHLYASFHSGRLNTQCRNRRYGNSGPISRQTLQSLSKVSRRSQRAYEQRTCVRVQRNDAVGPASSSVTKQEQGWKHGAAVYQLTDYRGRHGHPNARYLAWQLPNSYTGPHQQLPRGRQKRINRELADLFTNGMTGNDVFPQKCFCPRHPHPRRYWTNGKAAGVAERMGKCDGSLYWPATQTRHGRLWYGWETQRRLDDYHLKR